MAVASNLFAAACLFCIAWDARRQRAPVPTAPVEHREPLLRRLFNSPAVDIAEYSFIYVIGGGVVIVVLIWRALHLMLVFASSMLSMLPASSEPVVQDTNPSTDGTAEFTEPPISPSGEESPVGLELVDPAAATTPVSAPASAVECSPPAAGSYTPLTPQPVTPPPRISKKNEEQGVARHRLARAVRSGKADSLRTALAEARAVNLDEAELKVAKVTREIAELPMAEADNAADDEATAARDLATCTTKSVPILPSMEAAPSIREPPRASSSTVQRCSQLLAEHLRTRAFQKALRGEYPYDQATMLKRSQTAPALRSQVSLIYAENSEKERKATKGSTSAKLAEESGTDSTQDAQLLPSERLGGESTGGGSGQNARGGVLRPSLKGTKAMKYARKEASGGVDPQVDLRPVQELQDSESAVTCICFGQERLHKAYLLLATASKDGTVVIYRCYRTEMETQMLSDQDFPNDEDTSSIYNQPPADHSNIAVHSRLVGHSRAITSIFFNLLEDQLVTTSIDKSVRFWGVDSAEILKVFTDSSPVLVARFLPFNPQVFVAANSNAVLRLVNVQNGTVLQKLKVETEVRALTFDDSGLFLLAGTKNGKIHVLEASDSNNLKFKFQVQLARGDVTCITFVGANHGQPACLLVNTSDSSATIIDCIYAPGGSLTNLSVRHRVRVAHSLLPLKCCYSPSGQGYLISGSEDKEVCIYSLAKGTNYKMMYLKYHQVPVVAVAVNMQDTLLASADSLGRIVLWRRMASLSH